MINQFTPEKTEGEVLLSIKAIIITSRGGIPYFQDRFDNFEFDSTLLAGITSAISTYMDTFTDQTRGGFESMKNVGLIISSCKSDLSTIINVSDLDITTEIINQIHKSQILIDRKYRTKLDGTGFIKSFMDPITVYEMFDTAGFKIGFKKIMTIHEDSLAIVMDNRQIGPTLRYHLNSLKEMAASLPENNKFVSINELKIHFASRGLNDKEILQLQLLAYEHKVLRPRIYNQ